MAELNCYLTTFNCAREPINIDYFAANLFNNLKTNLPPDLVVLSLQEVAPISYSFLGGQNLTPYFTRFTEAVRRAALKLPGDEHVEYEWVLSRHLGLTGIMLFGRPEAVKRIRRIETAGTGVGLWEMGNKGAVGLRLAMSSDVEGSGSEEVLMTFVAAHLAPHENQCERRNADWKTLNEDMVFAPDEQASTIRDARMSAESNGENEPLLSAVDEGGSTGAQKAGSLFDPHSHFFIAGDLNYRAADSAPPPTAHLEWPQPVAHADNARIFSQLLQNDQLSRELQNNRTFHNLTEADIHFPPTYKYSSQAKKHAAKRAIDALAPSIASSKDDVDHWAHHRFPSWCDRILYLAAAAPKIHSYDVLPIQPTSDHRPVALSFSVPLKPVEAAVKPPFRVVAGYRERRAFARRWEHLVGLGAYLTLTWEGEVVLAGTLVGLAGGWLAIWAFLHWV
ncbi:hypothetical protein MBLNU230_g6895t1 [Neophaeotheca triangularis]